MAAVHPHAPIEAFKKSIREFGTFKTCLDSARRNMLTIEIAPHPPKIPVVTSTTTEPTMDPSRAANLKIRAKVDATPGIEAFNPIVKTNKRFPIDNKGKTKEVITYTVYLDLNLWTAEDEKRGYRKADIFIRTSVIEKQDERIKKDMITEAMKSNKTEGGTISNESATC